MRVLVFPVRLAIGGAQINAVDLAAGVRDLGHDVLVFSRPGPLIDLVRARRLRFIPAPAPGAFRPSPKTMMSLRRLVVRERIDLVHAWGPNPCLEAFYGVQATTRVPVIGSFMDMSFVDYLPRTIPLIAGTRRVAEEARLAGQEWVEVVEPPIDTDSDHPSVDGSAFRESLGIAATEPLVVLVSRLAYQLKLESIEGAIDAVVAQGEGASVRLVVVGDGGARPDVERMADEANRRLGRDAVVLTGHLIDPRPAYAAADVAVGMGSSILRAMAFGKPAIVLGGRGFAKAVEPQTLEWFLVHGFYGVGGGDGFAPTAAQLLEELLGDEVRRQELGVFSREVVCERFSIAAASASLDRVYREVADTRVSRGLRAADAVSTALRLAVQKARGREARRVVRRRATRGARVSTCA